MFEKTFGGQSPGCPHGCRPETQDASVLFRQRRSKFVVLLGIKTVYTPKIIILRIIFLQ